jgi:hypothetical protein
MYHNLTLLFINFTILHNFTILQVITNSVFYLSSIIVVKGTHYYYYPRVLEGLS